MVGKVFAYDITSRKITANYFTACYSSLGKCDTIDDGRLRGTCLRSGIHAGS